ncbi:hypothetical protein [Castellaniella defragrans]|uniref:hypothetical protein n=1 Tax=Castellaniella defragrans TaxID=75697 RepID=UPI0011DD92B0|nr:hypothetical protein [Castellaniella defragrans]
MEIAGVIPADDQTKIVRLNTVIYEILVLKRKAAALRGRRRGRRASGRRTGRTEKKDAHRAIARWAP